MRKLITSTILAAIMLTLAIFLIIEPTKVVSIIFFMIAIFILISAFRELFAILSVDSLSSRIRVFGIVKNVINLVFGAIIIYMTFNNPTSMVNVVVYLIAIDLLLTAISDALDYFLLYRLGYRGVPVFDLLLRITLSVVMFFYPTFVSDTFIKAVAIVMIVVSVLYFLLSLLGFVAGRKKRSSVEEIVVEYEEKD